MFATVDPREYILDRTLSRIVGTSCLYALALPPLSAALRPQLLRAFPAPEIAFWIRLWLPRGRPHAAVLGALGGTLEDVHASLAFKSTSALRRCREPELWSARSLSATCPFLLNPLLVLSTLNGEMKGSDCAMATYERRPVQHYPFFAVLDATRPSLPPSRTLVAEYRRFDGDAADHVAVLVHLLWCRATGGFYEIERHPSNEPWRIV
ncbi:hypothetical protein M885DRAFT_560691 [Pelagophyceae sp. CCMP2097]|nr:hypothetical protein M885DRAFT_560691 [Pelagophyceae sp. CCMP2097]|mmetsp:Transcript_21305/g.73520  ORF Transcript_21305/g.73520 Transcript_21305/m.73520 type:complete len:208 (+) Transcript_21305:108-731(+)